MEPILIILLVVAALVALVVGGLFVGRSGGSGDTATTPRPDRPQP